MAKEPATPLQELEQVKAVLADMVGQRDAQRKRADSIQEELAATKKESFELKAERDKLKQSLNSATKQVDELAPEKTRADTLQATLKAIEKELADTKKEAADWRARLATETATWEQQIEKAKAQATDSLNYLGSIHGSEEAREARVIEEQARLDKIIADAAKRKEELGKNK